MIVDCYSVGFMQTNAYILQKGNKAILIDPGDDAAFLCEKINTHNLKLQAIIATHGHFDHVMGVGEVQMSYPSSFYISSRDNFLLEKAKYSAEYYLPKIPAIVPIIKKKHIVGNTLCIDIFTFQILHTPGHTPGSICLYCADEHLLFSGDTLFKSGIGRYDYSYSSVLDLKKSLNILFTRDENICVLPGHGKKTTIGKEKAFMQYYNSLS